MAKPPHPPPIPPSERRRAPRANVVIPVRLRYDSVVDFVETQSMNISRTGMFIVTEAPAPLGSQIEFEFSLTDGFVLLHGLAEVVRVATSGIVEGMGVRFLDIDPTNQATIDRIVAVNTDEGRVSTLNFDFSRPPTDPQIPTLSDDLVELDDPAADAGGDRDGGISLNLDLDERPRVPAASSRLAANLGVPKAIGAPTPAKGFGTRSLDPESTPTPPLGVALRGPAAPPAAAGRTSKLPGAPTPAAGTSANAGANKLAATPTPAAGTSTTANKPASAATDAGAGRPGAAAPPAAMSGTRKLPAAATPAAGVGGRMAAAPTPPAPAAPPSLQFDGLALRVVLGPDTLRHFTSNPLVNVRTGGLMVPAQKDVPLGTVFTVSVVDAAGNTILAGNGKVVTKQELRIGLRLTDVSKESIARLQAEVAKLQPTPAK